MEFKGVLLLVSLFCVGLCQAQSSWSLKNGQSIEGKVLRITPDGDAVVQTASGISNYSLQEFSQESIQQLEKQFATLDLKKLADAVKPRKQRRPLSNVQGWDQLSPEQKTAMYALGAGAIALLIGYVLLLVAAFKENPMWGIAILLFSLAGLIFFILHFGKAKLAFLLHVVGIAGIVGGVYMLYTA